MVKFPEATARLFHNVFVCKRCKTKVKSSSTKVLQKKIKCKKCGHKSFRVIKRTK